MDQSKTTFSTYLENICPDIVMYSWIVLPYSYCGKWCVYNTPVQNVLQRGQRSSFFTLLIPSLWITQEHKKGPILTHILYIRWEQKWTHVRQYCSHKTVGWITDRYIEICMFWSAPIGDLMRQQRSFEWDYLNSFKGRPSTIQKPFM